MAEMNRKKIIHKKKRKRQKYKELRREVGMTFLIIFLIGLVLSRLVFSLPENDGYGMIGSLSDGDRVYVNRLGEMRRFSLIYFKQPDGNGMSIRRIIGLPGEQVRYTNDDLYIDGRLVVERFLQKTLGQAKLADEVITKDFDSTDILKTDDGIIPDDHYLVLGDNRGYATDSRYYGVVDKKKIIGTVELRWWPFYQIRSYR